MSESLHRNTMSLPASVLSYFTDRPTEMATDLLLAKKRPSVPEDVAWKDLQAFYKASLAAKQIEAEHAIFLNEVWEKVCKPMPEPWMCHEPYQQTEDCAIDLASIWGERCFTREFFYADYGCEIATCIGKNEGIQIGFGLWHDNDNLLESVPSAGWEEPDDILWSPEGAVPIDEEIDLKKLRQLAAEGMAFVLGVAKRHQEGD